MQASGSILVAGVYEGDLKAIAKLLNEWKWDKEGKVEFIAHDGYLSATVARACYPTVLPEHLRVYGGASEEAYKDALELEYGYLGQVQDFYPNKDFDEDGNEIRRPCAVILTGEISKLLRRGSITLLAFAKHGPHNSYAQQLVFHADGSAEWSRQLFTFTVWNGDGDESIVERSGRLTPSIEKRGGEFPPLLAA